jgi:Tn3 transposase DDE domain-containing protein
MLYSAYSGCSVIGSALGLRTSAAQDTGGWTHLLTMVACNGIARHRISTKLIAEHWDDLLRLSGWLKLGIVQATSVMRTLQIGDRPTKLAQAVAELGRIDKTTHALTYIDDEIKRRRILNQALIQNCKVILLVLVLAQEPSVPSPKSLEFRRRSVGCFSRCECR